MSGTSEQKIEDTQGKYLHAVKNGHEMKDATWQQCRIVLTSERIVIAADGKITVPLSGIDQMGGRFDINEQAAAEVSYSALHVDDDDVILVTTTATRPSRPTSTGRFWTARWSTSNIRWSSAG
jgi:helix-turn-helix protein